MTDPVGASRPPEYDGTNYQERRRQIEQRRRELPPGLKPPGLETRPLSLIGRVAGGSPGAFELVVDMRDPSSPVVTRVRPEQRNRRAVALPSLASAPVRVEPEKLEGEVIYRVDISATRDLAWMEESLAHCRSDFGSGDLVKPTGLGTSGSYFVSDAEGKKIAILKPLDEELGALRAFRKDISRAKEGIEPGTCGFREVIAGKIFPDLVPPTALVTTSYMYFNYNSDREGLQPVKQCSMQQMIPDAEEVHNLSKEELPGLLPHLSPIVMLDICLANSDRHTGNLLIRRSEEGLLQLFPIDHGCVLPDNFRTGGLFFWYSVIDPQAMFSEREQERIKAIDLISTREELKVIPDATGCINTYVASLILAKTLCETKPMKEIATYQLDDSDGMKGHKSLSYCMLKIAALQEDPSIDVREDIAFEINPETIQRVITDITSFIAEKKSGDEDLTVHLRVREVLNQYISLGRTEELMSGAWKSEI